MKEDNFKWTDELWKEFELLAYKRLNSPSHFKLIYELMEEFKQSKQKQVDFTIPKDFKEVFDKYGDNNKNWEIVSENVKWEIDKIPTYYDKEIISVRRISDGEVFTVGELRSEGLVLKITCEKNDGLHIWVELRKPVNHVSEYPYRISELQKQKQIISTTEYGKPIYEGDEYWYISLYLNNLDKVNKAIAITSHTGSTLKMFSTEEEATEYLINNKPCLSFNDVKNRFVCNHSLLKAIVKEKLKAI